MHAQVYEHHTRIVADQMFLKALDLVITKEKILDKKSLITLKNSSHKKFLKYYLELDDRNIYDTILNKPRSESAKILKAINCRKLLKRACDYPITASVDGDVAEKIVKMDTKEVEKEIAKQTKIDTNEIIVYFSQIHIKLYDKRDILVLWRGHPKDLNDLSPISSQSVVQRLLVYGPRDDDKRNKITKAVSDYLGVSAKEIRPIS